ncbi:MAG: sensor histidine kinase [Pleurocapsa sp.]
MPYSYIVSQEFANLCRCQMALLSQGFGGVWSAVYLTEGIPTERQEEFFPFAIYPQEENKYLAELPTLGLAEILRQLTSQSSWYSTQLLPHKLSAEISSSSAIDQEEIWLARKQLMLPLVHKDMIIGLLVAGRKDRDWQETEFKPIEEIASTLAIARFLDLQYEYSQEQLIMQQNLRRLERNHLEDLLHQLKNPLTALRTFSKLLIKRLLPEERNYSVAQSILTQSDRFQELLQQFEAEIKDLEPSATPLTLNTTSVKLLEANKETYSNFLLPESREKLESVAIQNVLEPLLAAAMAIAQERNIQLTVEMHPNLPEVTANFKALREVLSNLIDNALKYTPAEGKINLTLKTDRLNNHPGMLGIAIADTGYGISSEDRQHLFERHYRGIQAESDIPGSGLGLAIAKELIEQMQGEIELISPNHLQENSQFPGTTFIIWLPINSNQ